MENQFFCSISSLFLALLWVHGWILGVPKDFRSKLYLHPYDIMDIFYILVFFMFDFSFFAKRTRFFLVLFVDCYI